MILTPEIAQIMLPQVEREIDLLLERVESLKDERDKLRVENQKLRDIIKQLQGQFFLASIDKKDSCL